MITTASGMRNMSKNHNKQNRVQDSFSAPENKIDKKTAKPVASKPEEPIKLERVLVSDDFYWEIPGDIPASDRRYGMKMVPQGIPKPTTSYETSASSPLPAKKEKITGKTGDTDKQAFKEDKSQPVSSLKSEATVSPQAQTTIIETNDTAINTPLNESKANVAASILPQAPVAPVENDKDNRSGKGWLLWPLLLLLAAGLYEALQDDSEIEAVSIDKPSQPGVNVVQPDPVEIVSNKEALEKAVIADKPVQAPLYYITHIVVKGDTLWDISEKYHGDPFRYPELAADSNVKNPDLIYPGDVITIATTQKIDNGAHSQFSGQADVAELEMSQLKPVRFITHTVVKGDTLWHICKQYLGNPFRYPEAAKLSKIRNPDLIYPGEIIRMQL